MVADEKIFDLIPLKKEVKATISGIYITDVRGVRGPLEQPKQKEKFFQRMKNKIAKKTNKQSNNKKQSLFSSDG